MTYQDLINVLSAMSESERLQTATIHDCHHDEYFPVALSVTDDTNDVFDAGQVVIVPNFS